QHYPERAAGAVEQRSHQCQHSSRAGAQSRKEEQQVWADLHLGRLASHGPRLLVVRSITSSSELGATPIARVNPRSGITAQRSDRPRSGIARQRSPTSPSNEIWMARSYNPAVT